MQGKQEVVHLKPDTIIISTIAGSKNIGKREAVQFATIITSPNACVFLNNGLY